MSVKHVRPRIDYETAVAVGLSARKEKWKKYGDEGKIWMKKKTNCGLAISTSLASRPYARKFCDWKQWRPYKNKGSVMNSHFWGVSQLSHCLTNPPHPSIQFQFLYFGNSYVIYIICLVHMDKIIIY